MSEAICGNALASGSTAPRISLRSSRLRSLRHSHQFEHVSVRVLEIDAAAAAPIVELAVVEAPGRAAVAEARLLDAAEDSVELGVGNVEREVVTLERRIVIEQKRQRLVHPHRREVAPGRAEPQA